MASFHETPIRFVDAARPALLKLPHPPHEELTLRSSLLPVA